MDDAVCDLSEPNAELWFPEIPPETGTLPADFDTKCDCGKTLKQEHVVYRTKRRPFATFACDGCGDRLYIFPAPRIPFIIHHEKLPHGSAASLFSEVIDELIERREMKYARNLSRVQPQR